MGWRGPIHLLLVAATSIGCVTGSGERVVDPRTELKSAPAFPPGKYVHAVTVDVPGHGSWQMRGVLALSDSGIQMLGLSPMGTTVFRIDDEFAAAAVKVEIFQPELKQHEEQLVRFYTRLRPHLAGRNGEAAASNPEIPKDWTIKFFESEKVPPLPPTISVRAPKFSLNIEVDQYEP